jgi:hypothetical protein
MMARLDERQEIGAGKGETDMTIAFDIVEVIEIMIVLMIVSKNEPPRS